MRIEVDVEEVYEACRNSEKKQLAGLLEKDGFFTESTKAESVNDGLYSKAISILAGSRDRLTLTEEEYILSLAKKLAL